MRLVEAQLTGIFGSVLLLDKDGSHLRHGGAPSLAKDYTTAIDGIAVGPKVGSCGTAVHRRELVIVADIMQDPLWEDYRQVAAAYGCRSCWSTPILSHQGAVLGVFAMYSMRMREPNRGRDPPHRFPDAHCRDRYRAQTGRRPDPLHGRP
ncbi:GAF domain-containing protein [Mesorhizobium amorphae]|uniref:GAF domain-containing protein n=1 Tax=Mesorhizobium amorphae TaxID=71433 RepID=UPI001FEF0255|nr:GAF domain-containing protein [Mesorhizobium amorphae]